MTTTPRRAGPNPDGQTQQGSRQTRSAEIHQAEISKSPRRRIADALGFRPLCGEPLYRSRTGIRAWHHRSGAEAAFLVCETLHLHPDQFEAFATARVTAAEGKKILSLIERRVTTRTPTAYLVNKIYMRGLPFYVDERTIVPRSFIGELLDSISAATTT